MPPTAEELQALWRARPAALLLALGRARRALFLANEAWYAAGQPKVGPLLEAWHQRRAEWCEAFDAINHAADASLAEVER
jgi:hypothetical protein